jgi:hypothetical protein
LLAEVDESVAQKRRIRCAKWRYAMLQRGDEQGEGSARVKRSIFAAMPQNQRKMSGIGAVQCFSVPAGSV